MPRDLSFLLQRIRGCRTLQDFANASLDLLGNPMVIFDLNMHVLASTDMDVDDSHFRHLKDYRYPDTALTGDREWRDGMRAVWQRRDAALEEFRGRVFLSKMLRINDSIVGQLNVAEHLRPLTEDDVAVAELMSYPLAMAVFQQLSLRTPRASELDYCLEYLLDGNPLTDEQLALRAELASWQPGPVFHVLCANSLQNGAEYQGNQFAPILQKNDLLLRYRSYVVVLLSRRRALDADELAAIRTQLAQQDITCGLSAPFQRLSTLASQFSQACAALEIGPRVEPDGRLFPYADYTEYALIRAAQKTCDPLSFLMPGLLELCELDRRQQLELLKTLRIYLYNGRSVQQTADALHVHRNTVSYRIGRCLEHLHLELADGRQLLRLAHSIQILEYMGRETYFS